MFKEKKENLCVYMWSLMSLKEEIGNEFGETDGSQVMQGLEVCGQRFGFYSKCTEGFEARE